MSLKMQRTWQNKTTENLKMEDQKANWNLFLIAHYRATKIQAKVVTRLPSTSIKKPQMPVHCLCYLLSSHDKKSKSEALQTVGLYILAILVREHFAMFLFTSHD